MTRVVAGVVNFNGARRTLATLDGIFRQAPPDVLRVIVVDNGSAPADLDALRAGLDGRAAMLALPRNVGYAAACNAVAREAIGLGAEFVWFLNNDLTLPEPVLPGLIDALDRDHAVAAVAPVTVDAANRSIVLGAGARISWSRGRLVHLRMGLDAGDLPGTPYDVAVLEGACPLIRTSAMRAIGAWDESFFMYWEDVEWSVRATRSGARLQIVPDRRVGHTVAASSPPIDRLEFMLRNRVRFMRIAAPGPIQPVFMAYFAALWLPAFLIARAIPRFGPAAGLRLAVGAVSWNVTDAVRRRRWRLTRADQAIPYLG